MLQRLAATPASASAALPAISPARNTLSITSASTIPEGGRFQVHGQIRHHSTWSSTLQCHSLHHSDRQRGHHSFATTRVPSLPPRWYPQARCSDWIRRSCAANSLKHLSSALDAPQVIDEQLAKDINLGRVRTVLSKAPFISSPHGLVPKIRFLVTAASIIFPTLLQPSSTIIFPMNTPPFNTHDLTMSSPQYTASRKE